MIERPFDSDLLYNKVVHYYVDKKGMSKEDANSVAQKVVIRELERRTCKNPNCRHSMDDHIRNADTCLVLGCECSTFQK